MSPPSNKKSSHQTRAKKGVFFEPLNAGAAAGRVSVKNAKSGPLLISGKRQIVTSSVFHRLVRVFGRSVEPPTYAEARILLFVFLLGSERPRNRGPARENIFWGCEDLQIKGVSGPRPAAARLAKEGTLLGEQPAAEESRERRKSIRNNKQLAESMPRPRRTANGNWGLGKAFPQLLEGANEHTDRSEYEKHGAFRIVPPPGSKVQFPQWKLDHWICSLCFLCLRDFPPPRREAQVETEARAHQLFRVGGWAPFGGWCWEAVRGFFFRQRLPFPWSISLRGVYELFPFEGAPAPARNCARAFPIVLEARMLWHVR